MAKRDRDDDWLREHRELQYLRTAAVTSPRARRRRRKRKGIAAAPPGEQRSYLAERARKLQQAS